MLIFTSFRPPLYKLSGKNQGFNQNLKEYNYPPFLSCFSNSFGYICVSEMKIPPKAGSTRRKLSERKDSSQVFRNQHHLRLRQRDQNPLDGKGHSRGNLLGLPPVFHRKAKTGGYRRQGGTFQTKIWDPQAENGGSQRSKTRGFSG